MQESGILGFWSGVVPRALGEAGIIALTSVLTFAINQYVVDDKEFKQYTRHVTNFISGSLFYPLQVTSACMAVSRSGLAAGYPPKMPLYTGWVDCLKHLRAQGQMKRGSSLFFRYYTGPQVLAHCTGTVLSKNIVILMTISGDCWGSGNPSQLNYVQISFEVKLWVNYNTMY